MKATLLLLCLACSALAAPPTKKQPAPVEPLPALEKNTIAIDGHPESVAADAEGNIYFTCIGSRLTPTEKTRTATWASFRTVPQSRKKSRT